MTGGRLKRALAYVEKDEDFCFTYGDGLADIDHGRSCCSSIAAGKALVTLTATQSVGKFGALEISDDAQVTSFSEKPLGDGRWVSGGFFVLSRRCSLPSRRFHHLGARSARDAQPRAPGIRRSNIVASGSRWIPCMTRKFLEDLWDTGSAPWKIW